MLKLTVLNGVLWKLNFGRCLMELFSVFAGLHLCRAVLAMSEMSVCLSVHQMCEL